MQTPASIFPRMVGAARRRDSGQGSRDGGWAGAGYIGAMGKGAPPAHNRRSSRYRLRQTEREDFRTPQQISTREPASGARLNTREHTMTPQPSKPIIPNPGSDSAISAGCTCPVLDNHRGWGSVYGKGKFWINRNCPIHGMNHNGDAPK